MRDGEAVGRAVAGGLTGALGVADGLGTAGVGVGLGGGALGVGVAVGLGVALEVGETLGLVVGAVVAGGLPGAPGAAVLGEGTAASAVPGPDVGALAATVSCAGSGGAGIATMTPSVRSTRQPVTTAARRRNVRLLVTVD